MVEDNVYSLVKRQADLRPGNTAIFDEDGSASYSDIVGRADNVCQCLLANGLQPEQPVAVLARRNIDLVAVLLGILKAGGAYLPIDLDEAPGRALRMLQITECEFLIGSKASCARVLEAMSEQDLDLIDLKFIDTEGVPAEPQPEASLPCAPGGAQLAYIMFTSGSTGEPKAVEIEHRSMINLLFHARDLLLFTESDRYLAVSTISFDISIVELFLPLITGASLVLRDKSILMNPEQLARLVSETGINIVQTGPSVWAVLLDQVPQFPRLRVAISTGEAISPQLATQLSHYGESVWNLYGPTETTVWATACLLGHTAFGKDDAQRISAPIGHPLEGVNTLVLDKDGAEVHTGMTGELLVGGVCVARGYNRDPDLTSERFVIRDGARFYRTGDMVSRDHTGCLNYFGRVDDQLSIQGRRIEPREIEILILRDPHISQAAATWFDTDVGTRAIVAAIVLVPGAETSASIIQKNLKQNLPRSMIPAKFIKLRELPINKNGKVDRDAIRVAAMAVTIEHTERKEIPTSETEKLIASLWKRMMHLDDISLSSHFFAIGGDSLAAVSLNLQLEQQFDVSLPAQLVLEAPMLRDFAARIDLIRMRKPSNDETSFIFPLVSRPNTTPVFFCGADLTMARTWNLPCSLFAIAYWARGGKMIEMESIEGMARLYLEGVLKHQPKGPYRIAGYSFGAIVGLELAQQLMARGEEVETLFLLDPYLPYKAELPASGGHNEIESYTNKCNRIDNKLRRNFARAHKKYKTNGLRGFLSFFYPKIEQIPGGYWLMYQLFHLQARYPNSVAEMLVSRKLWPAFWYTARRKLALYSAKPYSGQSLLLFTPGQGGEDIWVRLFGQSAMIRTVDIEHLKVFDEDAVNLWMPVLDKFLSNE